MWDLSCPDWEQRLREGRPLIPELPLNDDEAALGLQFFDELQLPDVPGKPKLGEAAGPWFRDLARVVFGSWDPESQTRNIRDVFLLAPKASSKTSYSAGLMLTAMLMNRRPRAEALFIGPTQAISDRAYEQAVGMIEESADLKRRFRPRDHIKTIEDLLNHSEMKVKTFDLNILTGAILIFALLDELHLLGRNQYTAKVLRQIRGGVDKTAEGALLITTTQSDDPPAGAFKDELNHARRVRDGAFKGKVHRPLLPVLYEFPKVIATDRAKWENPKNWPMVMPNLGRSVNLSTLVPDWETEKTKGAHAVQIWASQHLNIEIGTGMRSDRWPGAEFWDRRAEPTITFESLLERCEVIVPGLDGGGLDDLYGATFLGREKTEIEVTVIEEGKPVKKQVKRWLSWSHAWCHRSVAWEHNGIAARRSQIATRLEEFEAEGDLTIVDDDLGDIDAIVALIERVKDAGKLYCVAADAAGLGETVDALDAIGVKESNKEQGHNFIVAISQGGHMMNAIKTAERRLANGTLLHAEQGLMTWCVANLKIEPLATTIRATKQFAGDAKIDPAMALFNAVAVMMTNPGVPNKQPQVFFV